MFNSVAIIGSSGGIGSELCNQIKNRYNPDTIVEFSRSGNWNLNDSIKIVMDICDESSINLAIDQLPDGLEFDLIFIATGRLHSIDHEILPEKSITQLNKNNMMETILINAIGPSLVAKALIPRLKKDQKSILAFLSARVGSISDNRLGGWYSYRSAKTALNMMIKSMSIEVNRRNKHAIILGVHPGTVDTNLSKPFQKNIKPEKIFSPEFSVSKILEVLNLVDVNQSGQIFAWDGTVIAP